MVLAKGERTIAWHRVLAVQFCLAAMMVSSSTQAAEPLVLAPNVAWTVDYGTERCSLVRRFGEANDGVTFQIDSYGSWVDFRFLVTGKPIPTAKRVTGFLGVQLAPDTELRNWGGLWGRSSEKNPSVSFGGSFAHYDPGTVTSFSKLTQEYLIEAAKKHEEPQPDFEARSDSVTLAFDNKKQLKLLLGNMVKPLTALRACIDDLHKSWGVDPAVQKTLSRGPVPLLSTITAIQKRYPSGAVYSGLNAFVPVRVMIDAEGNPGACVVQSEVVNEQFRRAVCGGLANHFEPALDAVGKPTASVYRTSVFYLIG